MKQIALQSIVFTLLLLVSMHTLANYDFDDYKKYKVISHNWSELSQNEYIDNLVACELKLQEHKWNKNIWPKENKEPKPAFDEVADIDAMYKKVRENLKKQAVLADRFNITINDKMLQHDLNRMAKNTKDANGLKQLFALLENNPQTITQCISRPYLVNKKFANSYNWHNEIHQNTKDQAQLELQQYQQNKSTELKNAQVNTITYKIKSDKDQDLENPAEISKEIVIEFDEQEYLHKLKELQNSNLQEKENVFLYTEIVQQNKTSFKIKNLVWKKETFNHWMQEEMDVTSSFEASKYKYIIPLIATSNSGFNNKTGVLADTWKTQNIPTGRVFHTVVWTGSRMIVWGGYDGVTRLNSGGMYDPVSDSWMATGTLGAPSGRQEHNAVWTGSKMIIWGGFNGSRLNTGGVYDPVSESWTDTSTVSAPSGRHNHTTVWAGNQMIVWGGYDGNVVGTGGRFDPNSNSWTSISSVGSPIARIYHSAIWSGSEMIIWGGQLTTSSSLKTNTGGRYNPLTDSWTITSINGSPSARSFHYSVWTGEEMIVGGGQESSTVTITGGKYNPISNTWQSINSLNAPYHTSIVNNSVWTGNELIVWSGSSGSRYNPLSNNWTLISSVGIPAQRSSTKTLWTGTEMIVWGGNASGNNTNTGGRYNPFNNSWIATDNSNGSPTARYYHTSVWTGSEMVSWGGTDITFTNAGGSYNPITDVWNSTNTIDAPIGRYLHTTVWTGSKMFVWGGYNGSYSNTGGLYDPISDLWVLTETSGAPSGRQTTSSVWNGLEVLIWGGYDGSRLNTGGRFDVLANSWQAINTVDAPSERNSHYNIWTGNEMVIWGGYGGSSLNSGGKYDPISDTWTATSQINVPTARYSHSNTSIWTGSEMIIWGGNNLNTGSRYNPQLDTWQTTTMIGVPAPRYQHSAVWTGKDMIVWGGGNNLNSGGRYNPLLNEWEAIDLTKAPSGRLDHTAIWTGEEMIVWGGRNSSGQLNSIGIYYPYSTYTISGNLTGLNGDQVILQNNGGDNLTLTANSSFEFDTAIAEGSNYTVTVLTDPLTPAQTCTLTNGSGTNIMADVTNVTVNCVNDFFNIGVTVSGLASGNSVFLKNNGGDLLEVSANSILTNFTTQIGNGLNYTITFDTQPTDPNQTCSIAPGEETGTVSGADVNVAVTCVTTQYNVKVNVSGLVGDGVSFSNGSDTLTINTDGTEILSTLNDGSYFNISFTGQPQTPNQVCSYTNADSGNLNGADYTVNVECVTVQYSIGGSISGLATNNEVVLQNNAGDDLTVSADGTFTFAAMLDDESDYAVTVLTDPTTPNQTCLVTGGVDGDGTGALSGNHDASVIVTCTTDQYSIGGTISGLATDNTVILQNNAGDDLTVSADGPFTFAAMLDDESDYAVTVLTDPSTPNQTCVVTGGVDGDGTGALSGNHDASVIVTCTTDQYSVGGTISGLANNNFVTLSINDGDELLVVNSSSFVFLNSLADGSVYAVTVLNNPTTPNQACTVTQGSGTVTGVDVTDITIDCEVIQYFVGGYVNGLIPDNFMLLQNNLTDDLVVTDEGAFAFSSPIDDEQPYEVTVQTQPDDPIQSCEVINANGSISGADVDDVLVDCEFGDDLIYRHGFDSTDAISRELWNPDE